MIKTHSSKDSVMVSALASKKFFPRKAPAFICWFIFDYQENNLISNFGYEGLKSASGKNMKASFFIQKFDNKMKVAENIS